MEHIVRGYRQFKINGEVSPQMQESMFIYKLKNLRTHEKYTITHNFDDDRPDNLNDSHTSPLNFNYPVYDCKFSPFEHNSYVCNVVNEMGFLMSLDTRETLPNLIMSYRDINNKGYPVYTIDWGNENNALLTTNSDKIIGLYDAQTHNTIAEISVKFSARCAKFNPWNNNVILAGGRNYSISLIDVRNKNENELIEPIKVNKKSHPPVITSVVFLNEHCFASCTDRLSYIAVWDSRYIKNRPFSYVSYYGGATSNIGYSHISTDATSLYVSCTDNAIYKFDISNTIANGYNKEKSNKPSNVITPYHHSSPILQEQPIAIYTHPTQTISSNIKLDVCGRKRLLLCGSQNNALILWDIDRPSTPIATLPFKLYTNNLVPGNIPAFGGVFSPHNDTIVARSYFSLCVWKPQFNLPINNDNYFSLDFSPTYNEQINSIIQYRKEQIKASDKVALEKKLPKNYAHPSSYSSLNFSNKSASKRRRSYNNVNNTSHLPEQNTYSLYDLLTNYSYVNNVIRCDDNSILQHSKAYCFAKIDDDDDDDDESKLCAKKTMISFFEGCQVNEMTIEPTTLKVHIKYVYKENKPVAKKTKFPRSIVYFLNPKSTSNNNSQIHSSQYTLIYMDNKNT